MRKVYVLVGTTGFSGKTFIAGVFSSIKKATKAQNKLTWLYEDNKYRIETEVLL